MKRGCEIRYIEFRILFLVKLKNSIASYLAVSPVT